jgi:hypothetical protein
VQVGAVQVPSTEPGAFTHVPPVQQSSCVVQVSPTFLQAALQRRTPDASGVQGSPQQSALDAQVVPGAG